ncbi:hypothetical protein FGG08_004646 [Glutinoglossum americanum]|uniref:RRM domain-containing protein n=1 Tax=Glutinoglossum americanum TaxID=1670608 RepID=A0A9P8HW02_9PEZI|nr:hypothetical protein FGG08_004646 [Glutinoglossum americanum]
MTTNPVMTVIGALRPGLLDAIVLVVLDLVAHLQMDARAIDQRPGDEKDARNPGSNLFVTGIHPRLSEAEVSHLFEKYGDVEKCAIMLDPHTKESRGFGFVKMVTAEQADAAKEGLQGERNFAGRRQVGMTATTIAVVAVADTRTLIDLVDHLVTMIASAIMAVILAMNMHHPAASTVMLRRDARTAMVVAMIDVVDITRENLVAPVNIPMQRRAREMLVTKEALTAEVEFTKIVLSMIDTPVDNCDR